jgi:hypothetical protein
MKWILLIVPFLTFGQLDSVKYNLSNSITGAFASNTKQKNFTFSGTNIFSYKKYSIYNSTSISDSWVTKKIAEEISHKSNITYEKVFVLYIFNRSLTRGMVYDNSFGIGYVHWWTYFSLSYGVLNENTIYTKQNNTNVFRHSLRAKLNTKIITIECYYQPNVIDYNNCIFTNVMKIVLLQKNNFALTFNDNINYRSTSSTKLIHSATINLTYNLKK